MWILSEGLMQKMYWQCVNCNKNADIVGVIEAKVTSSQLRISPRWRNPQQNYP